MHGRSRTLELQLELRIARLYLPSVISEQFLSILNSLSYPLYYLLFSYYSSNTPLSDELTSWHASDEQSGVAFVLSLFGWLVSASGFGSPAHAVGKEKLAATSSVKNSEFAVFI